jgi:class 3 adenylate cyclase
VERVVDTALTPLRQQLAELRAPDSAKATQPSQQLKQVSVLFVDVVGSTAIGQRLEPEDINAVMDGALERFTAIVESNHGRVLQYTGDGMLAAFGSQQASEDDVESAIRAGLGIIAEAQRLAPQVRKDYGVPDFNVRAGVHTGTVLLGGGVNADGTIRGATVNVAARMEQSAPPGRLRISYEGVFQNPHQCWLRGPAAAYAHPAHQQVGLCCSVGPCSVAQPFQIRSSSKSHPTHHGRQVAGSR